MHQDTGLVPGANRALALAARERARHRPRTTDRCGRGSGIRPRAIGGLAAPASVCKGSSDGLTVPIDEQSQIEIAAPERVKALAQLKAMRDAVDLDSFPSPACSHTDSTSRIERPRTNAPIAIALSGSVRNSFVPRGNRLQTNGSTACRTCGCPPRAPPRRSAPGAPGSRCAVPAAPLGAAHTWRGPATRRTRPRPRAG